MKEIYLRSCYGKEYKKIEIARITGRIRRCNNWNAFCHIKNLFNIWILNTNLTITVLCVIPKMKWIIPVNNYLWNKINIINFNYKIVDNIYFK